MKKPIEIEVEKIQVYKGAHNTDNTISLLEESIKHFGCQQPIYVDKNYVIVAGNAIYKAILKLGYKTAPCVVLDNLTDQQIRQYRIADNKTGEFAQWNEEKLKKELSYLQKIQDLQFCFDENLLSLINQPIDIVKNENSNKKQQEEQPKPEIKKQTEDFTEKLKKVEENSIPKPIEYFSYICSCCGKKVTIRKP